MFRIAALGTAILIIALLPLYEKRLDRLIEAVRTALAAGGGNITAVEGEEDILSNKGVRKLLIIGACVMILFMAFTTVSVATLNNKINTLSAATEDMMDRLSTLENK